MQLGMIGIGRMGGEMVRRLLAQGHPCVVYGRTVAAVAPFEQAGALGSTTLEGFVALLEQPRTIWLMIPAAAVDEMIGRLLPLLDPGDILIDGGNSHYHDDIRRSAELAGKGIRYLDVGTSGGIWGRERGYCLMVGGEAEAFKQIEPLLVALAPGHQAAPPTPGCRPEAGTAAQGYLHCGPGGAGHFVKMVHNGIEYGMMAALAEGFGILRHADAGSRHREIDAETSPLRHPEHFQYDFNLADIAELWRRGSVVSSWLLDLTARALAEDQTLQGFAGRVSDSGEGRWTINAAIDEGVPAPVLSAALFQRFSSRGGADFGNRLLSALRHQFGGHHEKNPEHGG